MQKPETQYLMALSFFEGIGPLRYRLLKKYFGSPKAIYDASRDELLKTGLGGKLVERFVEFRGKFNPDAFIANLDRRGIFIIGEDDTDYPKILSEVPSAPFILYGIGRKELLNNKLPIAIVGTRKPTPYGIEVTKRLVGQLVAEDFTIVSGMAMGVDAVAHSEALAYRGATIAVLGCGVDICYPAINKPIYDKLTRDGLILSEFPPGLRSTRGTFPSRNRIVAGLSLGVVITEGAKDSGALITATYASDFGRDVFAVPGPITSPLSDATMKLLKDGAKPVGQASDIIEEYKTVYDVVKRDKTLEVFGQLASNEKKIAETIHAYGTIHIDELARALDTTVSEIAAAVSGLVLKGILTEMAAGEYTIAILQ